MASNHVIRFNNDKNKRMAWNGFSRESSLVSGPTKNIGILVGDRDYFVTTVWTHPISGNRHYYYYNNSKTTYYAGLHNRHATFLGPNLYMYNRAIFSNVDIQEPVYKRIKKYLKKYVARFPLQPYTQQEYIDTMPPHYKKLSNTTIEKPSSNIRSFVKKEKLKGDAYKAPRLINARSTKYNVALGKYIKRYEKYAVPEFDEIAKGLDQYQMANDIKRKLAKFRNPMIIEVDYKSFDSHISPKLLQLEHNVYLKSYKNNSELQSLLRKQITNKITSNHGCKHTTIGTRMSGDTNTSIGNTLINLGILKYCLYMYGIEKYELYVNGDDSLIMLEQQDVEIEILKLYFNQCNMIPEIKISTPHTFEFCNHLLVQDDDNASLLALKPERISRYGMTHRHKNINDYNSYLRDVAYAYMFIYQRLTCYSHYFQKYFDHYNKFAKEPLLKNLAIEKDLYKLLQFKMKSTNTIDLTTNIAHTQFKLPPVKLTKYDLRNSIVRPSNVFIDHEHKILDYG
nr:RNA-dependent RNA polymerase [Dipteran tombus-related virus]